MCPFKKYPVLQSFWLTYIRMASNYQGANIVKVIYGQQNSPRVKQINYVTETDSESAIKKVTVLGFNFFRSVTPCVLFFC